ncbi:hypothetical protein CXG81DRAFT_15488 [Caulochytrium protostelioides]|uniref:MBOAT-domain-containing protein n=1 Tax=Caulochytrium protostelioides TaxID=1555241 RepID=A0A4P9X167_9FUNG|nr:hypothetical protein CXG81DRAFT_15488 [Caulochytrium protostelioides]|eukprot:RKO98755.1 hypothetical protein CXG81DRAFT_15488 [Caulochytrium protostelioides]
MAARTRGTAWVDPAPPRWKTPEFLAYLSIVAVALGYMCYATYHLSRPQRGAPFVRALSPGWLFGGRLDNSDPQYRSFRNNIPLLVPVACVYALVSRGLVQRSSPRRPATAPSAVSRRRDGYAPLDAATVNTDTAFSLMFSLGFLTVFHGASVLKIVVLITLNFAVVRSLRYSRASVAFAWLYGIGMLYANHHFQGYPFGALAAPLAFLDAPPFTGITGRWWNFFNFTMLRMISFTMDAQWTLSRHSRARPPSSAAATSRSLARSEGVGMTHEDYTLVAYLAYLLYVPLYLAGPIISFNDWYLQMSRRRCEASAMAKVKADDDAMGWRGILVYAARWLGCVLLQEAMLHAFYVVAISRAKAWGGMSPFQVAMVSYFNLKLIWMKLLIIWRFFRLWALMDGVLTVENMDRCMSNNYSALGFWRHWHRSYNRWLVRYMYVPLGGRRYSIASRFLVFTFVAVWHDVDPRLLAWGWLVALLILPEVVASAVFRGDHWQRWPPFRHLCAVGAVFNILLMMTANLVGFAVGIDGMLSIYARIFQPAGLVFLATTAVALFAASQIMFELERGRQLRAMRAERRQRHGRLPADPDPGSDP